MTQPSHGNPIISADVSQQQAPAPDGEQEPCKQPKISLEAQESSILKNQKLLITPNCSPLKSSGANGSTKFSCSESHDTHSIKSVEFYRANPSTQNFDLDKKNQSTNVVPIFKNHIQDVEISAVARRAANNPFGMQHSLDEFKHQPLCSPKKDLACEHVFGASQKDSADSKHHREVQNPFHEALCQQLSFQSKKINPFHEFLLTAIDLRQKSFITKAGNPFSMSLNCHLLTEKNELLNHPVNPFVDIDNPHIEKSVKNPFQNVVSVECLNLQKNYENPFKKSVFDNQTVVLARPRNPFTVSIRPKNAISSGKSSNPFICSNEFAKVQQFSKLQNPFSTNVQKHSLLLHTSKKVELPNPFFCTSMCSINRSVNNPFHVLSIPDEPGYNSKNPFTYSAPHTSRAVLCENASKNGKLSVSIPNPFCKIASLKETNKKTVQNPFSHSALRQFVVSISNPFSASLKSSLMGKTSLNPFMSRPQNTSAKNDWNPFVI